MNKDVITIFISLTIILCASIVAFSLYNINDRNNMSRNIESAIAKGIDPISVKCAYEIHPTATCIAYSLSIKK